MDPPDTIAVPARPPALPQADGTLPDTAAVEYYDTESDCDQEGAEDCIVEDECAMRESILAQHAALASSEGYGEHYSQAE
jgi:hypothetical protein